MSNHNHVCGVEHAKFLDNIVRRLIHHPRRLFGPYIKPGDTVLDIGCGPGTFITGLAHIVGAHGKVIAIDLQEEMLNLARKKAEFAGVANRVEFHQCTPESLGINIQADFIMTIYMVHEAPEPLRLVDQVGALLKNGGYYYLSEPAFHVSKAQYREAVDRCMKNGLTLVKQCGIVSRTAVFRK
ncbi:MAG: methyltransferase domain-containing protein [Chitinivibrionales bacterium]|nr:methyltransferase domain-containing protein [Chitinivibrionales bacterium]